MPSETATRNLVQTLAAYLPPALIRRIAADPQAEAAPSSEHFVAAVLLADVSGFTALTEKLAAQGPDGAEELTRLINGYFSRMIDLLTLAGGEVVQFSGDALTAVFAASSQQPEDLGRAVQHAALTARQMQAAMADFAVLHSSAGPVELRMKIVIGAGPVEGMVIGGVHGRWQYLIAGDPLRQVAEAEGHARRGEIVLSPEAEQLLLAAELLPAEPGSEVQPGTEVTLSPQAFPIISQHISGVITSRLMAGQSEWLAELRQMSLLFLGIAGLEQHSEPLLERMQPLMAGIQTTVYRYEGSINKLLIDDKGAISIILFGAPPLAHHDDPQRAVRCALELHDLAAGLNLKLAIGITSGQVFAGPVGSSSRREYTVMGDKVNLAARLMKLAGPGGIRADHATYSATAANVEWQILPPQMVKGKAAPVRVYQPQSWQEQAARRAVMPLIGREAELGRLNELLDELEAGRSRVLLITGEAGLGKTRLLQEVDQCMQQRNLVGLRGSGQAIEQQTPYRAWRDIFRAYFGLAAGNPRPESERAQVLARLRSLAPAYVERAALLNDVLNLGFAESELSAALDARLRHESLHSLLLDLLARWAIERPLILILDDAQWLDPLSWELALDCSRSLNKLPLLLVAGLQPLPDASAEHPYHLLAGLGASEVMDLAPLAPGFSSTIAARRLEVAALPAELADLVERVTAGIPFVAEELALSLRDNQIVQVEAGQLQICGDLRRVRLPDTARGMVLSRIDRLHLDEQLTMRVAAVIGPQFSQATLQAVFPVERNAEQLRASLQRLQAADLLEQYSADGSDASYQFRQSIIREAVYGTLLRSQRRTMHERVADWYERRPAEEQPEHYPLLAYHWQHAGNTGRELHYATLAGRRFAAEYANQAALSFLNRALELVGTAEQRVELLWLRLPVWERIGERAAQRRDLAALRELLATGGSASDQARLANAWAAYHRDVSDYPAALHELQRGLELARATADQAAEAQTLTLRGQISEYQGDFRQARDYFEAALQIYQRTGYRRGEAENLSRIGNIAYYLDNVSQSRTYALAALEVRRSIKDLAGEATSLVNLAVIDMLRGDLEQALGWQQAALALAQNIGDRFHEAICYSSLAQMYQMQARYADARDSAEQALHLFRTLGERRYETDALNALGLVWRDLGQWERARQCFIQALEIQQAIGDQNQAAYSHLNLSMVLHNDISTKNQHANRALELARAGGDRFAEAYALSYRANLAYRQQNLPAAIAAYRAALVIHEEINPAGAAETQAGLAQALLAAGDTAGAAAEIEHCLHYLAAEGITGIEFPAQVWLDCYDGLLALGEAQRAAECLEQARQLVMERAAAIGDPELRNSYLEHVPAHRRVLAEAPLQAIERGYSEAQSV